MHYDVAAYGRDGNLAVVGETKVRLSTNTQWAASLRSNIVEDDSALRARFFLLALPDRLYLWPGDAPADALPTVVDAGEVFGPYFKMLGVEPSQIQPAAFENIVSWWLSDLTRTDPAKVSRELRNSGFVDAIAGGRISRELAA
jgi:hypothetical protein